MIPPSEAFKKMEKVGICPNLSDLSSPLLANSVIFYFSLLRPSYQRMILLQVFVVFKAMNHPQKGFLFGKWPLTNNFRRIYVNLR